MNVGLPTHTFLAITFSWKFFLFCLLAFKPVSLTFSSEGLSFGQIPFKACAEEGSWSVLALSAQILISDCHVTTLGAN